jgi:hypothetical protein
MIAVSWKAVAEGSSGEGRGCPVPSEEARWRSPKDPPAAADSPTEEDPPTTAAKGWEQAPAATTEQGQRQVKGHQEEQAASWREQARQEDQPQQKLQQTSAQEKQIPEVPNRKLSRSDSGLDRRCANDAAGSDAEASLPAGHLLPTAQPTLELCPCAAEASTAVFPLKKILSPRNRIFSPNNVYIIQSLAILLKRKSEYQPP